MRDHAPIEVPWIRIRRWLWEECDDMRFSRTRPMTFTGRSSQRLPRLTAHAFLHADCSRNHNTRYRDLSRERMGVGAFVSFALT
jgi:hypothetical protein